MTLFDLYSRAITAEHEALPCEPFENVCCVSGIKTLCIPKKYAVGSTFTNVDALACPDSKWISVEAYQTIKHKWNRMSSWLLTDNEFKRLKVKKDIRELVLQGVDASQWAGYITTSYKKYGCFKAVLNHGNRAIWGFENLRVDCSNRKIVNGWYDIILSALKSGIWRSIIESCDCPAGLIIKIGHERWLDFYEWAKTKYQSPLYQFLCYLLPSQEELKNESETA